MNNGDACWLPPHLPFQVTGMVEQDEDHMQDSLGLMLAWVHKDDMNILYVYEG